MRPAAPFLLRILPLWLALALPGCRLGLPSGDPPYLLAEGKRLYAGKRWSDASRCFRAVLVRTPDAPEAEEGGFLYAEASRRAQRGQTAFTAYKDFLDKYPTSRFAVPVAASEYRLGTDFVEGRMPGFLFFGADRSYGVTILEHMQINFRNHSLADDALARVGAYHMKERNYAEAVDAWRRLLAEYPRSSLNLLGRYELARALWLRSEGVPYDERVMAQGMRAFRDYIDAARAAPGGEEAHAKGIAAAEKLVATIQERLAEKQVRIGRFYEKRGAPQSAQVYYRYCVGEYPGTRGARESAERLAAMEKPR